MEDLAERYDTHSGSPLAGRAARALVVVWKKGECDGFIEQLAQATPSSLASEVEWQVIDALFAPLDFASLREVPQHEAYHGEGDVYVHTQLVCVELGALEGY